MPPRPSKLDYEPFYQYHNRLASFLSWPLNWEMDKEKPTPEALARAGFFNHTDAPYTPGNVTCPFCHLSLDDWEANDDPMHEHYKRSPFCAFVRGRPPARKVDNDGGGDDSGVCVTARATRGRPRGSVTKKSSIERKPRSNRKSLQDDQEPDGNMSRQTSPHLDQTVAIGKAKTTGRVFKAVAKVEGKKRKLKKQHDA